MGDERMGDDDAGLVTENWSMALKTHRIPDSSAIVIVSRLTASLVGCAEEAALRGAD